MPSIPRAECFHSLAYTNDYWEWRAGENLERSDSRQEAERQDEERATGAKLPEEDATRRHGGYDSGSRTCPCSMLVGLRCLRTGPVAAYRLHTESVVILSLLILEVLDLCRSIRLPY